MIYAYGCMWSAFDNMYEGPRWATTTPNGVIVVLHLDPDGRWDAHFTNPFDGARSILRLGTSERDAFRDATELAKSI